MEEQDDIFSEHIWVNSYKFTAFWSSVSSTTGEMERENAWHPMVFLLPNVYCEKAWHLVYTRSHHLLLLSVKDNFLEGISRIQGIQDHCRVKLNTLFPLPEKAVALHWPEERLRSACPKIGCVFWGGCFEWIILKIHTALACPYISLKLQDWDHNVICQLLLFICSRH